MPSDPMLFAEIVTGVGIFIVVIYGFVKNKVTGHHERRDFDSHEFPNKKAAEAYKDQFDKGANR